MLGSQTTSGHDAGRAAISLRDLPRGGRRLTGAGVALEAEQAPSTRVNESALVELGGSAGRDASAAACLARVSVIIPTLNEAANLPHVLTRIPDGVGEVLIVDGHSTDDTIAVARALRNDVRVLLQNGTGKGNALACGFAAAKNEIIVMLDADGSTDPREIPAFIAPLLQGADFVKGTRFARGGASTDITPLRRMGNEALNGIVNLLYGTSYTDLCYGYNAFWAHCLPHMNVTCDGFEVETLINIRIALAGLDVREVPSIESERLHGESNLRVLRDGRRVLRTILTERVRRQPDATRDWRPAYREVSAGRGKRPHNLLRPTQTAATAAARATRTT